ncbi:MAG: hypothetical protein HKL80_08190 [Acidimicrobiales bacterium]|nr:hypothetical protein [Acidimicrobiales bacterium]
MTENDIDSMLTSGETLLALRKDEKALEIANKVIGLEPNSSKGYLLAARASRGLKRDHEAMRLANIAVALDPNNFFTHCAFSEIVALSSLKTDKRYAALAVRAANEAIRLNPNSAASYNALANALAASRDFKQADAAIRKAIELSPLESYVWISASSIAIQYRNHKAGMKACQFALKLNPTSPAAINNLGACLNQKGQWTIGAVAFFDSAKIDPRSSVARSNVESIGYRYLQILSILILLPLLIIFPIFLIARLSVATWISRKPEILRPLANRLGLRVATSKRNRNKFEKYMRKAQKRKLDFKEMSTWSVLKGRQNLMRTIAYIFVIFFLMFGIGFAASLASVAQGKIVSYAIGSFICLAISISLVVYLVKSRS